MRAPLPLKHWAMTTALLGAATVAALLAAWPTRQGRSVLPGDCAPLPRAYYPGTVVEAQAPGGQADEEESFSALFELDDGRRVHAYKAGRAPLKEGERAVISETPCVHRTIYLVTEFPPGTPPAKPASQ